VDVVAGVLLLLQVPHASRQYDARIQGQSVIKRQTTRLMNAGTPEKEVRKKSIETGKALAAKLGISMPQL